jgi:hypothetical protein
MAVQNKSVARLVRATAYQIAYWIRLHQHVSYHINTQMNNVFFDASIQQG